MFSGLIMLDGRVDALVTHSGGGARLVLDAHDAVREGIARGDSIAVDGVCLTAVAIDGDRVSFDVVPETLERSTLGTLSRGDIVNLELSLRLGDRLGGHLVYGHVDARSTVRSKAPEGNGFRLEIATPIALERFIVEKGYITVDGVSLTVASTRDETFTIALIPETAERTTLGKKDEGAFVNLEIDPIARYALAAVSTYGRGTS